jgi:RNA polymerase sigma factor (sigma-70 family)
MSTVDPTTLLALERHGSFVRRLARSLCADENEANDLVQETWLATLRAQPSERGGLRPWLESVLRRAAWTRRRADWRRTHREQLAARPESAPDPTRALAWQHEVVEAVLALDESYREAVLLTYEGGLSAPEIARRLGVPAATIRTRLGRARAQLRDRLERRFGAEGQDSALLFLAFGRATSTLGTGVLAAAAIAVAAGVALVAMSKGDPLDDASVPVQMAAAGTTLLEEAVLEGELKEILEPLDDKQETARTPVVLDPFRKFWAEVRELRDGAARFDPARLDSTSDRALRAELDAQTLPGLIVEDEESLAALVEHITVLSALYIHVEPAAEEAVEREGVAFNIHLTNEMPVSDVCDLLARMAGNDIVWQVRGGIIEFTTRQRRDRPRTTFSHDVRDLLLDPTQFVPEGTELAPLFPAFNERDLISAIQAQVAVGTWREEQRLLVSHRGFVICSHNPEEQSRVQDFLDHLRGFYLPLPKEGRPGKRSSLWFARGGATPAAVVAALNEVTLTAQLADARVADIAGLLEKTTGLDFHVTRGLQEAMAVQGSVGLQHEDTSIIEVLDALEARLPMRWYIADRTVVLDTPQASDGRRQATELFDIRALVNPPCQLPLGARDLDPRLLKYLTGTEKDLLTGDQLAAFIQQNVDSKSWDEDPAFFLMVSSRGVLEVHQTLRVLGLLRDWLRELEAIASR